MSQTSGYITAVVTSFFGHDAGIIAEALTAGPRPLQVLYSVVKDRLHKKNLFRKQVTLLFWYHIVECHAFNGRELYAITFENVLRYVMLSSQLSVLQMADGDEAFAMVKALVKEGRLSASDLIRRTREAIKQKGVDFVQIFQSLTKNKVIIRTHREVGESDNDPFLPPTVMLDGTSRIAALIQAEAKLATFEEDFLAEQGAETSRVDALRRLDHCRRQRERELRAEADKVQSTDSDRDILWRVNFNILDRLYRDRLLVRLLVNDCGIDSTGEKIMRGAFTICSRVQEGNAASAMVKFFSRNDVQELLQANSDITKDDYETTLFLVASCADRFIRKVGDSNGGLYEVNYTHGMRRLFIRVMGNMINSMYENPAEPSDRQELPQAVFSTLVDKGLVDEDRIATVFKQSEGEIRSMIYRMHGDKFVNVVMQDTSYEFNPQNSHFLYGVDLLQVNRNQFQNVLQWYSNYVNRRLYEKEKIVNVKKVKARTRKAIENAKRTITDDEELAELIEDVQNEFDQGKRRQLRQYRLLRDYLKKVEMMLNEIVWIMHRNREMEERKRKDERVYEKRGFRGVKRTGTDDAGGGGGPAKRAREF